MKLTMLSLIGLLAVSVVVSSPIEVKALKQMDKDVTDYEPVISLLLQMAHDIAEEKESYPITPATHKFQTKFAFFTIEAELEILKGSITGLDSLKSLGNNTMTTIGAKRILRLNIGADNLAVKIDGILKFFTFEKKFGLEAVVKNLKVATEIIQDGDNNPTLSKLQIVDMDLNVNYDLKVSILGSVVNKVFNTLAKLIGKLIDVKKRLVNIIRPLLEKPLKRIKFP